MILPETHIASASDALPRGPPHVACPEDTMSLIETKLGFIGHCAYWICIDSRNLTVYEAAAVVEIDHAFQANSSWSSEELESQLLGVCL